MDARLTVIEDFLRAFPPDEVEKFSLHLLGSEFRDRLDIYEQRLSSYVQETSRLEDNLEQTSQELGAANGIIASLRDDKERLESALNAAEKRSRKLEDSYNAARRSMLDAESRLANQKPPHPDLEKLEDYLRGIRPDPRCTIRGCHGKRGYSGFTATIDPKTGEKKITVNLCCGKVGESDYALISRKLSAIEKVLDEARKHSVEASTMALVIFRHTLFGGFKVALKRIGDFFKTRQGKS